MSVDTGGVNEHDIQNSILEYLTLRGHLCWRNNSGKVKTANRYIQLAPKGSPDIIGIHKDTGAFIGLEVKKPGKKPTEEQMRFREEIAGRGGIAGVVCSLEDVVGIGL